MQDDLARQAVEEQKYAGRSSGMGRGTMPRMPRIHISEMRAEMPQALYELAS